MKDYIPEIEFDPNNVPDSKFATYRPGRSPTFKLHKTLGHAKNAASNGVSIVYEHQDGKWVPIINNFRNVACTVCGGDYRKPGPFFFGGEEEVRSGVSKAVRTVPKWDKIWNVTKDCEASQYFNFGYDERGCHLSCKDKWLNLSDVIKSRLAGCVGPDTAVDYEQNEFSDIIWTGQCVPVSLIVNDELGGEIMRSVLPNGESHYWNKVEGIEIDLTIDQYPLYDTSQVHPADSKPKARDYLLSNSDVKYRYDILRALYDLKKK
jgi:hypothetical protein